MIPGVTSDGRMWPHGNCWELLSFDKIFWRNVVIAQDDAILCQVELRNIQVVWPQDKMRSVGTIVSRFLGTSAHGNAPTCVAIVAHEVNCIP